MPRPTFGTPKLPTMASPLPEFENFKCGEGTWDDQVDIHMPFREIDRYVVTLGKIGDTDLGSDDRDVALPALLRAVENGRIQDAIDRARELLKTYYDDGHIEENNADIITGIANRAQDYLNIAKKLNRYWEREYTLDDRIPPGWPLLNPVFLGCSTKSAEKGSRYVSTNGGRKKIDFTCPLPGVWRRHYDDGQSFIDLVYAAMVNARCAQEAAASVGVYNRNRADSRGRTGIGGLAARMPKAHPMGLKLAEEAETGGLGGLIGATEVEPEEPELEEPGAPPSVPKKKKDNTMLLVGAAALGVIMLAKR